MVDILTQLWLWDRDLSDFLAVNSRPNSPLIGLRSTFLVMEWLVHGIPWLICTSSLLLIAVYYRCFERTTTERLFVLLIALLLDLIAIGVSKMTFRRARPPYNEDDQVYEAPVADRYSFPSGHSSRAAMLAILGLNITGPSGVLATFLKFFPLLLGLSRVLMGRHYVSDVLGGWLLGVFEALFILIFLPQSVFRLLP